MKRMAALWVFIVCTLQSFAVPAQTLFDPLDLDDPADNLLAFVKLRGSTDPNRETVFYFEVAAYSQIPQVPSRLLFNQIGFTVSRMVPTTDGYQQLSREILVYRDPATGAVLDCWNNPLNGRAVTVLHVANDPVNLVFAQATWRVLPKFESNARVTLSSDVLRSFPNPLQPAQYPDYSAGFLFQESELLAYSTNRVELDTPLIRSATAEVSWTRVGQWLPWMQMGSAPGQILYRGRGAKLRNFDALPAVLKTYVAANFPAFRHAPSAFTTPNEDEWTYFKKRFDSGEYVPTCQ
jgi:hypothetical protein